MRNGLKRVSERVFLQREKERKRKRD